MVEPRKTERVNPLDAMMTKAQVVRRKFKSTLPRTIKNEILAPMTAIAKALELYERFRSEMAAVPGLSKSDVSAALVYVQPETPGLEHTTGVAVIPDPDKGNVGMFVETTLALDKPLFLGVLFIQTDRAADKPDKRHTIFVWPFMGGPEAEKRLKIAQKSQAQKANDYSA
jgi:hypothetical protein